MEKMKCQILFTVLQILQENTALFSFMQANGIKTMQQLHSRELILYDAAARYLKELKAVERLRKAADQLARQEQDKSHDRGPEQ